MNAGKSSLLLQSDFNYRERGMTTLLLVPSVCNRSEVRSRIGLRAPARPFTPEEDLFKLVQTLNAKVETEFSCVLVDEAQFLTKAQVWSLAKVADQLSIPVLTYGLRTDFRGEPFEGSLYLLAIADELKELKTICHCGRKAVMNVRTDSRGHILREGEQILIGGNESYVSVCRHHFLTLTDLTPLATHRHEA